MPISLNASFSKLNPGFELVVSDGIVAENEKVILLVPFAHLVFHVPIVLASCVERVKSIQFRKRRETTRDVKK